MTGQELMARVEELGARVDDPAAQELVSAVMDMYGEGLRRVVEHDATVAAFQLLAATGQLNARFLTLDVPLYDPAVHYNEDSSRWIGVGTEAPSNTGYILP